MKSKLPPPPRLTKNEKKVIAWAFNVAHSIVAGDYHLPQPMNYAINNLQDAVHELAHDRGISVKEGCSDEYLGFSEGYRRGVVEKISGR